jgi:hypothetical protein
MSMWRRQRGRLCCLVRPEQLLLLLPEREPPVQCQCRTVTQTRSPSVIWNQHTDTPSPSFADSTGSVIRSLRHLKSPVSAQYQLYLDIVETLASRLAPFSTIDRPRTVWPSR